MRSRKNLFKLHRGYINNRATFLSAKHTLVGIERCVKMLLRVRCPQMSLKRNESEAATPESWFVGIEIKTKHCEERSRWLTKTTQLRRVNVHSSVATSIHVVNIQSLTWARHWMSSVSSISTSELSKRSEFFDTSSSAKFSTILFGLLRYSDLWASQILVLSHFTADCGPTL